MKLYALSERDRSTTRRRLGFVAAFILLLGALDWVYIQEVVPTFGYVGFSSSVDISRMLASVILIGYLAFVSVGRQECPSQFFLHILLAFVVVPVICLWSIGGASTPTMVIVVGAYQWTDLVRRAKVGVAVAPIREGPVIALVICFSLIGLFAAYVMARGGYAWISFFLESVYAVRAVAHEQLLYGLAGYLWSNVGKAVLPVLLVVGLARNKWMLVGFAVVCQMILLGLTNHKELFFYPVLIIAIYFAHKYGRISVSVTFILIIFSALLGSYFVSEVLSRSYIISYFAMRGFFITAENHYAYFEFFNSNPFVYLSNNVLSGMIDYPYDRPIPEVIGKGRYGEGSESFANTGFIASSFMQFGYVGVFLYSTIVGILFGFIDCLSSGATDKWLVALSGFPVVFQLVHTDLTTALATHGLALFVVLLYLGQTGIRDK